MPYIYTFELRFSKRGSSLNFKEIYDLLEEACENINNGLAYRRDGKSLELLNCKEKILTLNLTSKRSLPNPARSLSALTRYLTTFYRETFEEEIYNKTLFAMKLTSITEEVPDKGAVSALSHEELLKGMIDLLYSYTALSNADALKRKNDIEAIKQIVVPYIQKEK